MAQQDHNADRLDLAIIGAGAAGLATAIFAAEANPTMRIALLDGAKNIGAKILVAGGGRCNVTHFQINNKDYHGPRNRIKKVLAAFTVKQTIEWFESLGVTLKREDTGKLFPTTDKAATILHALTTRCAQLHIDILTQHRVTDINEQDDGFVIEHSQGQTHATHLVLATGGQSLPRTGSDGAGWRLAKKLGHTITDTHPALAPLVLNEKFFHEQVAGVALPAELTTLIQGKRIDRRSGSLLWTHFGISGPVAMDASRFWTIASAANQQVELRCNLLLGETFDSLEKQMIELAAEHPQRSLSRIVRQWFPQRLGDALCQFAGVDPTGAISQLPRDQRRLLVRAVVELTLPVERDRGWNYAEVTAGGVPLEEIDTTTMRSKVNPALQLVGEIIDVDGRIGGFNFQWAWATGRVAGQAFVKN